MKNHEQARMNPVRKIATIGMSLAALTGCVDSSEKPVDPAHTIIVVQEAKPTAPVVSKEPTEADVERLNRGALLELDIKKVEDFLPAMKPELLNILKLAEAGGMQALSIGRDTSPDLFREDAKTTIVDVVTPENINYRVTGTVANDDPNQLLDFSILKYLPKDHSEGVTVSEVSFAFGPNSVVSELDGIRLRSNVAGLSDPGMGSPSGETDPMGSLESAAAVINDFIGATHLETPPIG